MSIKSRTLASVVVVFAAIAVALPGSGTRSPVRADPHVATRPATAALTQRLHADHQRLVTELAGASDRAVRRRAVADLTGFFQDQIAPYLLSEVIVLYPVIDSLVDSHGYAVTAALPDAQMIERVASDLGPQTDIRTLEHHSHLLAALVGNYFDKECLVILPILGKHFSDKELQPLIDRLDAERARSCQPLGSRTPPLPHRKDAAPGNASGAAMFRELATSS